ncbi:unnamed protein product [Anisakis simplex]|uniref:Transposase n=1 Tax=Anisakis simplex TaxID=6269 RepID=A0A0M3KIV8_ANISI|nr:unnamed protein product [Anisakis simplex]
MRRDNYNMDVDTRRKNHEHRARYGEPGHPELALHGKHEPYGGRGHIQCSDLLQVLTLLCFMPRKEELARWVENHWPISTRTLPRRLGVEAAGEYCITILVFLMITIHQSDQFS